MRLACILLVLALPCISFAQDTKPTEVQAQPSEASVPGSMEQVLQGMAGEWLSEGVRSPEAEGVTDVTELNVLKCVELALSQNESVLVAQDDVDAAIARIGIARSQRFPQVKTDVGFTHTDYNTRSAGGLLSSLAGGSFSGPGQILGGLLDPSGVNIAQVGFGIFSLLMPTSMPQAKDDIRRDHFGVTQVLYAGGQIKAAIAASKYLAESQEWKKQSTLNDLEYEVKSAYYDCLLTQGLVRVAEESIKTFERHLADAQQMLDVGLVSNFEVLRAKTELGARKADHVAAQNALRLALTNLRRILNIPQDAPVLLKGEPTFKPLPAGLEESMKIASEVRPELVALDKAILAAQKNVRGQKGQYLPRAAATADWNNYDGAGSYQPDGWNFALGVELDIYAGGRRKAQVSEAQAQLRSLEHQRQQASRVVEFDVRQSYIRMEDAEAKSLSEKGTVELGREGLRLAQLRFQEGVGTQGETLDAELALTSAEVSLLKALREYVVARAALEKALGESLLAEAPESKSCDASKEACCAKQ